MCSLPRLPQLHRRASELARESGRVLSIATLFERPSERITFGMQSANAAMYI